MDDETKLFYNRTAQKNADEWYENYMLMPSIEEFIALLPENPHVLDLGCGGGYESMRLMQAGAQVVVGVDFSEESIRIARERCPQARFELMDFRLLDSQKLGKFDGIFACASLIHIKQEELPNLFRQMSDILKENGFLIAIVRDGDGIWERRLDVEGQKLERVVYLHSKETLIATALKFIYIQQGYLARELFENGWRSHLFQLESK